MSRYSRTWYKMSEKKSFWEQVLQSAVSRNPVLIQMLAICTIMAAGTLKFAVIFSATFCVMFLVTQTLANLFMAGWKRYFRVAVYAAVGTACAWGVLLMLESLDKTFANSAGIYLTMLAVSGVTVLHCEKVAINVELRESLREAIIRVMGYSGIMIFIGALRELLGAGQLWGHTVLPDFGIPFFEHPMSALFMLGFMAAALRVIVHLFIAPNVEDVALKVSNTAVSATEPEREPMPEEIEYASVVDEPVTVGEIPVEKEIPIHDSLDGTDPGEVENAEMREEPFQHQDDELQNITVQPAELEDTQQRFEDMLADLRRKYLDDKE